MEKRVRECEDGRHRWFPSAQWLDSILVSLENNGGETRAPVRQMWECSVCGSGAMGPCPDRIPGFKWAVTLAHGMKNVLVQRIPQNLEYRRSDGPDSNEWLVVDRVLGITSRFHGHIEVYYDSREAQCRADEMRVIAEVMES